MVSNAMIYNFLSPGRSLFPIGGAVLALVLTLAPGSARADHSPCIDLIEASFMDETEEVLEILSDGKGVDVNCRDGEGQTPLMVAAEGGSLSIVKILLSRGSDPSARDPAGRSSTDRAEYKMSVFEMKGGERYHEIYKTIRTLIHQKIDANIKFQHAETTQ